MIIFVCGFAVFFLYLFVDAYKQEKEQKRLHEQAMAVQGYVQRSRAIQTEDGTVIVTEWVKLEGRD